MDKIGYDVEKAHGISEGFDPTFTIASDALKYTKAGTDLTDNDFSPSHSIADGLPRDERKYGPYQKGVFTLKRI